MNKNAQPKTRVPICLAFLLLSSCEKENTYVAPPPPTVTVSQPDKQQVTEYLTFTGTTEAVASVEIRARVKGFLKSVLFEEGDRVEKDELLYEIDPSEYDASVAQASALLQSAEAGLELAEATLKRMEEAVKKNAVSIIDVLESKARRDQSGAQVAEATAALTRARLDLGYTKIHAPMSGLAGRNEVDVGNLVGAGENTLLTTLVQMDPIYATFDMSERELLTLMNRENREKKPMSPEERLKALRALPLELGVATDQAYPHKGYFYYMDQGLDASTGTFLLQGIFKNPHPLHILPGLFVRLRTPRQIRDDALLVPERALGADQSGRYLLVVNAENTVEYRGVKLGEKLGDRRVIKSGLSADDRVVVDGLLRARPGAKVTPETAKTASAPATAPSPGS